jgi:8-oxo-dGTP pyrophosphatase MutT (NUDIX family)
MIDSARGRALILAAGGIVVREGPKARIAVVRLRRDKAWVLPKGKLIPGERALAAAKREVLEETGYKVSVHEFLGSMSYAFNGKIKIVQFWHMRAVGGPVGKLTNDVKAVKWLSLKQAIETLTRAHEKVFLANVGPTAPNGRRKMHRLRFWDVRLLTIGGKRATTRSSPRSAGSGIYRTRRRAGWSDRRVSARDRACRRGSQAGSLLIPPRRVRARTASPARTISSP